MRQLNNHVRKMGSLNTASFPVGLHGNDTGLWIRRY